MTTGISSAGREAERLFREITGATPTAKAADGDALLNNRPVEIKQTSTNTLNQVRPVKYLPLVVFDKRSAAWYVVPPDEIVRLVARRLRGQQTENPFESVTISLSKIGEFKVAEADLQSATIAAFRQGDSRDDLRAAMSEIRSRSSALAKWSRKHVQRMLQALH